MKSLERLQILSFASRGAAMAVGIIQGIVVVRLLTVGDFGMVGIVMGVGSIFGVSQNLGLASGSTREISRTTDKLEISKIFFTSAVIKYVIALPLALILFLSAEYISINYYDNPDLILPLRIFSFVLLIQGVQSLFNSTLSGMQRFKFLFTYQALIAFVSLALYIPFVYFYGFIGYFYALFAFNSIASVVLGIVALAPLRDQLALPSKQDFKRLLGAILSISLGIYAVKIMYTIWQKSGPLLLGLSVSTLAVGYFNFALFYATKLMVFSDAVTDVNLPVLSKEYLKDLTNFKKIFSKNFNVVFSIVVLAAFTSVYWLSEIVAIAVGDNKYDPALYLVLPLIFAFIFYSFINIVKSSVMVPAKLVYEMIAGYALLLISTIVFYFVFNSRIGALDAMAYGMAVGGFLGLLLLTYFAKSKLQLVYLNLKHFATLMLALLICLIPRIGFDLNGSLFFVPVDFIAKSGVYILLFIVYLLVIYIFGFITKEDFGRLASKLDKIKK